MNVRALLLTAIALAAFLGGCATHNMLAEPQAAIARTGVVDDAQQRRLERAMTDGQIATLLDLDVRAKLPTSLAVAKLRSNCAGYQPALERIDAGELAAWEKIAAKHAHLRGVHPISNLAFGDDMSANRLTLRSLRVAAARLHCELLLVYMQADSNVDNFNEAAALYWTLAGLWLVPGDTLEHKTVMQAILVDCRTGAILGTATGDAHKEANSPAMFVDIERTKLAKSAPAEALADLQDGCDRLLIGVVARATAAR